LLSTIVLPLKSDLNAANKPRRVQQIPSNVANGAADQAATAPLARHGQEQQYEVTVVNIIYWSVMTAFLFILAFTGIMRPTGFAGRSRAQEADEDNRSRVARWLKKQNLE
jgi:hypothetical protein